MQQTFRKAALIAAIVLGGLVSTACTTTLQSNPSYVAAGLAAPVVKGKAVLVLDEELQDRVITAHPTSYTGGATSISAPMGEIVADVGDKILDAAFSDGAEVSSSPKAGSHDIKVELNDFSYMYDQLSSLGFQIKPKVTVALTANAVGPDGAVLINKKYTRKDYLVAAYVISGKPAEKINEALHMALGDIFREIVDDVVKAKSQQAGAASAAP